MQRRPARLDRLLAGRWRKAAADECPDVRETWRYWKYTKSIMQQAAAREAVELPETENRTDKGGRWPSVTDASGRVSAPARTL
jgi:hypothetical protein